MAPFDWSLPYPSRREPVVADGIVATSHPIAAQAGREMLRRGGNAADAALAPPAALTGVAPPANVLRRAARA
ncbi:MAG: gamma-glutamyltransferase, partial [Planctomycetota bacterium]|nr:gamma-glutamyltransferase [Planctomycetota bacterium]